MKRHVIIASLVFLGVMLSLIPIALAAPGSTPSADYYLTATPVNFGPLDYDAPDIPIQFGENIQANDACDGAAPSYIQPGTYVYPVEIVGAGAWTSQTTLTEMQFGGYSEYAIDAYLNNGRTLHATPNGFNGPSFYANGPVIGDEFACVDLDGGVALYWSINFGGQPGWLLESVRWTDYVLNPAWVPGADGNTVQVDPPALSDFTLYYWSSLNDPDLNVELGGDTINSGVPVPATTVCDHGAPSVIQVGDTVEVYLTGYSKWPDGATSEGPYTQWDFSESEIVEFAPQSINLLWLVDAWMGRRPLGGLNDQGEPDLYTPLTEDYLPLMTVGEVISGPLCSVVGGEYLEPVEFGVTGSDKVYTWWLVAFDLNGQTVEGWYPESGVYHYYRNQPFNFADFYYFLRPLAAMQAPQFGYGILNPESIPSACADLPPSLGVATVYPLSNLNVRSEPSGRITGRAPADQVLTLQAPSVCLNGYRWRSIGTGWIAESGPAGYLVSLTAPPAPTEPPAPTAVPATGDDGQDAPPPAQPTPTERPIRPTATFPDPQ